jgi:hypothetical protein
MEMHWRLTQRKERQRRVRTNETNVWFEGQEREIIWERKLSSSLLFILQPFHPSRLLHNFRGN